MLKPLRPLFAAVLAALALGACSTSDDAGGDGAPPESSTVATDPSAPQAPDTSTDPTDATAPEGSGEGAPSPTGGGSGSPAASVCDTTPQRCSNADGLKISGGRMVAAALKGVDDLDPTQPVLVIVSEPRRADGGEAELDQEVTGVHVVARLANPTGRAVTFRAPVVAVDLFRDGVHLATYETDGGDSTVAAGGEIRQELDLPMAGDGSYVWQARMDYR